MTLRKTLFSLLTASSIFGATNLMAQDKPEVKVGGALRFNYNYSEWKNLNKNQMGVFGLDVFRINANASYKGIKLNTEYRFYPEASGGAMLKHGYLGYDFNENNEIQVGLTNVPFGLLPYTSNSFFFNMNYYLGMEDDADMGVKYTYRRNGFRFDAAFFKNSDINDFGNKSPLSDSRYAYDVAGRNKEVNQGNIRVAYTFGDEIKNEIGASAQAGGLLNLDTEELGSRTAFAVHYNLQYKGFDIKAQYTTYNMNPKNKKGESCDVVSMTAYGAPYNVAAKSDVYSATIAYTIPVNKGFLDNIRLYNDFSMMHKKAEGFNDSYQNIVGMLLTMGNVYTYVDCAMGKNQAWLGGNWSNAFAQGEKDAKWHTRFNINLGYYF